MTSNVLRQTGRLPVTFSLMAIAFATLAYHSGSFAQCNQFANGCSANTPVPCSNASCVSMMSYPGWPNVPNCDNGNSASAYTATSAPSWQNCQAQIIQYGQCNDANITCANAWLYSSTPCNQATLCSQTATIKSCGYGGTGVACN